VIQENFSHNPTYYEKLWELLMRIIQEEENRVKSEANDLEFESKLKDIHTKATQIEKERRELGFDRDIEFAIYTLLQNFKDDKEKSIQITKQLSEKLLPETLIVEWWNKPSTKRKTEEITFDILESAGLNENDIEKLSEKILYLLNPDNV
jgi:hypothetical protein